MFSIINPPARGRCAAWRPFQHVTVGSAMSSVSSRLSLQSKNSNVCCAIRKYPHCRAWHGFLATSSNAL